MIFLQLQNKPFFTKPISVIQTTKLSAKIKHCEMIQLPAFPATCDYWLSGTVYEETTKSCRFTPGDVVFSL